MAGISARSLVKFRFNLHLCTRLLLGLTTFVTVVSMAPMHGTVASLWVTRVRKAPFSDCDFRQGRMLATLELLIQPLQCP